MEEEIKKRNEKRAEIRALKSFRDRSKFDLEEHYGKERSYYREE